MCAVGVALPGLVPCGVTVGSGWHRAAAPGSANQGSCDGTFGLKNGSLGAVGGMEEWHWALPLALVVPPCPGAAGGAGLAQLGAGCGVGAPWPGGGQGCGPLWCPSVPLGAETHLCAALICEGEEKPTN